jgi:glucose/arabinose dehydrogenase/mono/diheme cytochrome c family protein
MNLVSFRRVLSVATTLTRRGVDLTDISVDPNSRPRIHARDGAIPFMKDPITVPGVLAMVRRLVIVIAAAVALSGSPVHASLLNRWSFNNPAGSAPSGTTFTDQISGFLATVRGNGAILSGSSIVLPGTTTGAQSNANISAFLDLPNGILSSKTNLTVEVWVTAVSSKTWQRIFDFGSMAVGDGLGASGEWTGVTAPNNSSSSDDLMLAMQSGAALTNSPLSEARLAGGTKYQVTSTLTTTAGTLYYFALTFTDGAGTYGTGGGQVAWYRNGVLVGTVSVPFHLYNLNDVNDWLGRSQFSPDNMANIAYNEVRIYDNAFSATDVTNSYNAGPDAPFPPPVTNPDSVTMQYSQQALINVLANDSGTLLPSSVAVVQQPKYGTAAVQSNGEILYTHTTGAPVSDIFTYTVGGAGGTSSQTTVTINFTNNLRIANSTFNVPSAPPATSVTLVPAFPNLPAFNDPVCLASPPGDLQRLFVCDRWIGRIMVIPNVAVAASATASPVASVFLDLGALLTSRGDSITASSEAGLLGLAFHPSYATNGYFYIFYTVKHGETIYDRLSRFTMSGTPLTTLTADPTTETILFSQARTQTNHHGGDLHFGPDGYLYVSVGDGGAEYDTLGFAQQIDNNLFSGILRIDVDKKAGNLEPDPPNSKSTATIPLDGSGKAYYSVPADNPFIGTTTFNGKAISTANLRTEFWAVGLRNPWRFCFDSQLGATGTTGNLYCGNVGMNAYEGVYLITKGNNCGWPYYEQNHEQILEPTAYWPAGEPQYPPPANFTYTPPIYEYDHSIVTPAPSPNYVGAAVIGGVVYRGVKDSSLAGNYIFGDNYPGNIWSLVKSGTTYAVTWIAGQANIAAFGTDPSNGDVLVASAVLSPGSSNTAVITRITTSTVTSSFPQTLSATGIFANVATLSPNPGVLPYTPNLTFWSDFALKTRFFCIPDATSKMTWSQDSPWTFPAGMFWVKSFGLQSVRSNPPVAGGTSAVIPIETRLLVETGSGVYGVSYRWNAAGTDATLETDAGDTFAVNVTQNGQPYTQTWSVPSRASCITCHNPLAGGPLSFTTRQLNKVNSINGFSGNQLTLLQTGGYFSNAVPSPNLLPRMLQPSETNYPIEARVRSYFAVNCAYCHQSGGTGPSWDGRPQLTLAQTGLIGGTASIVLNTGDQLVVPGDTVHSIVLSRMMVANGYSRMPPLASSELDQTDIALIQQWIANTLPAEQTYDQWHQAQFHAPTPAGGDEYTDADGTGQTNYLKFLAGLNPLNGSNIFLPAISISGGNISVSFNVPANRSVFVQTSTDLVNWNSWDVPGNGGLPQPGGLSMMTGVALGPRMFFRVNLQGN